VRQLNPDWREYRRSIEWRCRWLELRMGDLHLRALRYEALLRKMRARDQQQLLQEHQAQMDLRQMHLTGSHLNQIHPPQGHLTDVHQGHALPAEMQQAQIHLAQIQPGPQATQWVSMVAGPRGLREASCQASSPA